MGINIKKVAVFGGGVMGPGIVQIMTYAGREVAVYDISEDALAKTKETLHKGLETFAGRGMIKADEVETLFNRVTYTTDMATALKDTDIVLEAVSENPEIKKSVYAKFDELAGPDTILASNTSFLNIFELTPENRKPKTCIAHWYQPANVIPLVEVVPNEKTEEEVMEAVMALLKDGGKQPVRMNKFIRGYIVNRLQMCLNQEVFYLLENGYCDPAALDMAVKTSFIPRAMVLGLVQRQDFAGVQMTANNIRNKSFDPHPLDEIPTIMQKKIDAGDLGLATGKGYYDYTGYDKQEVLAKRDKQLFEAFDLEAKFLADPLPNKVNNN